MAYGDGEKVEVVVVGNGPSALLLSYILHGHIPYYTGGHRDHPIDRKLGQLRNLLNIDPDIYNHIRSSLSYSSQALPINTLLDTLLRPDGDTDLTADSHVDWRYEAGRAIPHIVLGDASQAGGQWAQNPVSASWDIECLSYAEQLSLPGYTFANHWQAVRGEPLPELIRPTRKVVAEYLARYPAAVGIADSIRTSTSISSITRLPAGEGFHIAPLHISCRKLVLASGIFNILLQPPPFLNILKTLRPPPGSTEASGPVLIVGSGFTAADLIISTPPHRKIIHIFNWDPNRRPSPLKGCHGSAYPEYAWIYRVMRSSIEYHQGKDKRYIANQLRNPPKSDMRGFAQRDWAEMYEGFPNARIMETSLDNDFEQIRQSLSTRVRRQSEDLEKAPPRRQSHSPVATRQGHNLFGLYKRKGSLPAPSLANNATSPPLNGHSDAPTKATVLIGRSYIGVNSFDDTSPRTITSFHYAAGRRGSLSYLHPSLLQEVLSPDSALSRLNKLHHLQHHSGTTSQQHDIPTLAHPPTTAQSPLSPPRSHASLARTTSSSAQNSTSSYAFPDRSKSPSTPDATHDFAHDPFSHPEELLVTGQTLREKIEAFDELNGSSFCKGSAADGGDGIGDGEQKRRTAFEVAKDVFVVGSLTGDSLIRFAFGGCCAVAGVLMGVASHSHSNLHQAGRDGQGEAASAGAVERPQNGGADGQKSKGVSKADVAALPMLRTDGVVDGADASASVGERKKSETGQGNAAAGGIIGMAESWQS